MSDASAGKRPSFFKERIYPILFMILVTVVFISVVSGIYLSTEDLVLLNESLFEKKAVLYAAGIEVADDDGQEVESTYNSRVKPVETSIGTVYEILGTNGSRQGLVINQTGPGLWGEITAVVGFDTSGKKLTGVDFTKQNETPGLGARIMEDWFREQFRGKTPPFTTVPEGTAAGEKEFDAITGATRTSDGVLGIMNNSLKTADTALKEIQ